MIPSSIITGVANLNAALASMGSFLDSSVTIRRALLQQAASLVTAIDEAEQSSAGALDTFQGSIMPGDTVIGLEALLISAQDLQTLSDLRGVIGRMVLNIEISGGAGAPFTKPIIIPPVILPPPLPVGAPVPGIALPIPWFHPPIRWRAPPGFEPTFAQRFGIQIPKNLPLPAWFDPPKRWNAPPGFEPTWVYPLGTAVPIILPLAPWFDPPKRWVAPPGFEPTWTRPLGSPPPLIMLPPPWFDPPKRWIAPPGFDPTFERPFGIPVPTAAPQSEWWTIIHYPPTKWLWSSDVPRPPPAFTPGTSAFPLGIP